MNDSQSAETIDEVLARLDKIVAWSLSEKSRAGYFAALYRRVTQTVRSQIGTGFFDNDQRMRRLDVTFANRYLTAFQQWRDHDASISDSWEVAFEAVGNSKLLILQHLLVGMNAHINYDLGIAAATIAPTESELQSLHDDFNRINCLLACLVPTVFAELGDLSPMIHLLEEVGEQGEEGLVGTVMDVARDFAWMLAHELAALKDLSDLRSKLMRFKDREVHWLGAKVVDPGTLVDAVIHVVRLQESKDVEKNITELGSKETLPQSCLDKCKPA